MSAKKPNSNDDEIFALKNEQELSGDDVPQIHKYGKQSFICTTDAIGFATPQNRSPLEIVVDATEGFIPLWDKNLYLRWTFNNGWFSFFKKPSAVKSHIRGLLGEALQAWGDAVPIKYTESAAAAHDFEIVVRQTDNCSPNGCVLASAFFPDAGRHQLVIYPMMFKQTRQEQVETLVHEIGHTFGLRHFFAKISETKWSSEIFGVHEPFSIMNYGAKSVLTDADRGDLKTLYQAVWNREITEINGTPIRLVRPYHYLGNT